MPEDLHVPDRFEGLRDAGTGALQSIIVPVQETLDILDERFVDMRAARRGSLMLLRGNSGAGKSTFLDTVGLFRHGVVTERVSPVFDIQEALQGLHPATSPRIVVLEGREALGDVSESALEAGMHAINTFVRSGAGRDTLVVWPINTDELADILARLAFKLGGEALLSVGEEVTAFSGPRHSEFVGIAERTVAALNEGASLAALGISEEKAVNLAEQSNSTGQYLATIRRDLIRNGARVRKLLKSEQFRLWTLIISGNDSEGDVAALTRGGYAYADIDRLMTATGANIVSELKKYPDTLGILGTVLDAKILNIDMVTILAIARQYGDRNLHLLMRQLGMSTSSDKSAEGRVLASELGLIISGQSLGTRKRGSKPGSSTQAAYANLAKIARSDDGILNRAIGTALVQSGLAESAETERELGTPLKYVSDLYVLSEGGPVRIEVMWRSTTSRAEIANYVLSKLGNYARAIGLLES
jgi:hypothetical protein